MFIRAPNFGRKLLLTCIVAGVMIAILVSCLQFLVAWHKHEVKYDTLITDVQKYLDTYFADLKSTTDRLQPLTLDTCQQANPELTARAAFSMNVRTFVLVKDKKTFCSSATGEMDIPLNELIPALDKAAPQYFHGPNVAKALHSCRFAADRNLRLLADILLREVLLEVDDNFLSRNDADEEVIRYERAIIDASNEDGEKLKGDRAKAIDLLRFLLEVAWDKDDDISPDEKNLIEKARHRLGITDRERRMIEARLGKFPRPGNQLHTRGEITDARRQLHEHGLLLTVRDDTGTDFDVIPAEIAACLRVCYDMRMRRYGYDQMLQAKQVRSKEYYGEVLRKIGFEPDPYSNLEALRREIIERIDPKIVLGGLSPKDGLPIEKLREWCADIAIPVSGTKPEVIERIIGRYDALLRRPESGDVDERAIWFEHFESLARRDTAFFRSQDLIVKDIEVERRFEDATNYLFEAFLGHKPLKLAGTNHADGALSFGDAVVLWDNKSSEVPVHLPSHLEQFAGYVRAADRRVAGFLVIGPEFTEASALAAMEVFATQGVIVTLIPAAALKQLALAWKDKAKDQHATLPLGFLLQQGLFNPALVWM